MSRCRSALAGVLVGALSFAIAGCGAGSSPVSSGCKPDHHFSTISQGKLAVGIQELPPFISLQGKGGMSGVEADIVKAIAADECLDIKPVSASPAAMVPGVQNGRIDVVIGNWYRDKARSAIINFTDPIYLDDMGVASATGIDTLDGMAGKTVGTIDGALWVADLKKVFGDNLKLYPSSTNLHQDVKVGRLDVWLDSYVAQLRAVGSDDSLKVKKVRPDQRVATSIHPPQIGFILPKNNAAMLDAVNADLAKLRADGTLAKILSNYKLDPSISEVGKPRLIG